MVFGYFGMSPSSWQLQRQSRVDYCITTMDRPDALERLLLSIAAYRPHASIHIADQSERFDRRAYDALTARLAEAGLASRPTLHRLPFDCGVSAARNYLMDSTPGEFKLLLDDDFAFTESTDIDALIRLMDAYPMSGAVGGGVTRRGQLCHIGSHFNRRDGVLDQVKATTPIQERAGVRFQVVDCLPMFALVRRELSQDARWDPKLKTAGEDFDFFLRVRQTPYFVLYVPDVTIDHPPIRAKSDYVERRMRSEFLGHILAKHELRRMTTMNGTVMELRADGQVTWCCEISRQRLPRPLPHDD